MNILVTGSDGFIGKNLVEALKRVRENGDPTRPNLKIDEIEYYGAAEPPVRCGESHLSGLTEPPQFVY